MTSRIWIKGGTGFIVYAEDRVQESFHGHHKKECLVVLAPNSDGNTSITTSLVGLFTGLKVCINADAKSCKIDGDREISGSTFLTLHSSDKQLAEKRWSPLPKVFWFKPRHENLKDNSS